MSTTSHAQDEVHALDEAFKELRTAYEKYFAGVDRTEPQKARDDFKKRLRRLTSEHVKNTARRFKLQTMQATLVTHEQYWNRITRQIEEGTYKRDRMRAAKILAEAPPLEALPAENTPPEALTDAPPELPAVSGANPATPAPVAAPTPGAPPALPVAARPAAARPTPPAPPAPPPLAAQDPVKTLHAAFVNARRQLGDHSPVPFEAFSKSVASQSAAIKAKMQCKDVEFRVAEKDGKVILKAVPK